MLAIILWSLLGTGWVSFNHTRVQDALYNQQRLARKEAAVQRSLHHAFSTHHEHSSEGEIAQILSERICELSDVHGLSIAIYNPEGRLLLGSVDGSLTDGSVALSMPTESFDSLAAGEVRASAENAAGETLVYWWFGVDGEDPHGIAHVRYDPRRVEQSGAFDFVRRLLPVYLFLFVVASLVAALLTKGVVRRLRPLRERMKPFDPTVTQLPLEYAGNDAISQLVSQYNTLLTELQSRVAELAKSEREGAWRLMAMQVAHEIKNPLTPLRLGVQQLERTWTDRPEDFSERLSSFTAMAVSQIDVLSRIASDFAMLANIDPTVPTKVSLSGCMREAAALFESSTTQVTLADDLPKAMVSGSHSHLIRVFNNLIQNAVQAIDNREGGAVRLNLVAEEGAWLATVEDNGPGIGLEDLQQVFQPNFTTKSGGTGLGLAMVRSIVTQFEGTVSVQSTKGENTVFRIMLPRPYPELSTKTKG